MADNTFANLDARWLFDLHQSFIHAGNRPKVEDFPDDTAARLLSIAGNLERMDARQSGLYARGFQDGKDSSLGRSNLHPKSNPIAPNLAEALANFKGEVTKLPPAEKKAHDDTLSVADLDFDLSMED